MRHPIPTWSYNFVQYLRKQSACINKPASYIFTDNDRQAAIAKLQTFYKGRINPSFADRILYLSELY